MDTFANETAEAIRKTDITARIESLDGHNR